MLHTENQTRELRTIGEAIDHDLASKMIKDFQETYPNERVGNFIGRDVLDSILAQPGCMGIRFYNAINEVGKKTLVYVGLDADNKIMTRTTAVNQNGQIVSEKAIVGDRSGGGPDTAIETSGWDLDWFFDWF